MRQRGYIIVAALLFVFFSLGFISFQYSFDGTLFAMHLELAKITGAFSRLIRPHHLLYEPMGLMFWKLATLASGKVSSILALQLLNLLLAGINLVVFGLILFAFNPREKGLAALVALSYSFAFANWFFAVEPEVYVLAILIVNTGFLFALKAATDPQKNQNYMAVGLAFFGAFSILGHLMYGLFGIVLLYCAWLVGNYKSNVQRFLTSAGVLVGAGAITFGVYAAAYNLRGGGPGFLVWLLAFAKPESPFGYKHSYWNLTASAPRLWLKGLADSFWGVPPAGILPSWALAMKLLGMVIFVSGIILWAWRFARMPETRTSGQKMALIWLVPGAFFTMLWEPGNFEHKVYLLPSLFILFFLGISCAEKPRERRTGIMAAVLLLISFFTYNFFVHIGPGSKPENNSELQVALALKSSTPSNAEIVISGVVPGYNIGKVYIPFFSQRRIVVLDRNLQPEADGQAFPNNLRRNIDTRLKLGTPVFLLSDSLEPAVLETLSSHHGLDPEELKNFWNRYKLLPVGGIPTGYDLFRVTWSSGE